MILFTLLLDLVTEIWHLGAEPRLTAGRAGVRPPRGARPRAGHWQDSVRLSLKMEGGVFTKPRVKRVCRIIAFSDLSSWFFGL